jgi:hypothetical protein
MNEVEAEKQKNSSSFQVLLKPALTYGRGKSEGILDYQ